ncbi:hypothetical protein HZC53_05175 [Candidatus Uhrbacteria bacterium]|nr:hypothetical protein [Candidatus Uhrbacteria bacterium]
MIFLQRPDDVFYVRELTRLIDTQINAVRRELKNLVDIGLLIEGAAKEEEPGLKRPGLKRRYYVANNDFPLMQEVRALLLKAYTLMEWKLDEQVRKLGDVRYLAFMGIFIGQRNQPLDVFVIGDMDKDGLKSLMQTAESRMGAEINYTVMSYQEYIYRRDMADRFLEGILKAPKSILINRLDEKK